MKKITVAILSVLTLPAYGGIAATEYVNETKGILTTKLDSRANKDGYDINSILQTNDDGELVAGTLKTSMIQDNAVTNSRLASGLGLDKLDVGILPACGKNMLIWNAETERYVFEPLLTDEVVCDNSTGRYDLGFAACTNANTNGKAYGYINISGSNVGYHYTCSKGNCTQVGDATSYYGLTQRGTWSAEVHCGVVYGSALCSSVGSDYETPDENNTGSFCWCKITRPRESGWVYLTNYSAGYSGCSTGCAQRCAYNAVDYNAFRIKLFSAIGE